MAFIPPIPLIRKNVITKKLEQCGAISIGTAKTLSDAGVTNPNAFKRITDKLVSQGIIGKTAEDKYYLK